jgi:aconitate hydratase
MGILPLQFLPGENADTLKLTGQEVFEIAGIRDVVEKFSSGRKITVRVKGGEAADFQAIVRIDTLQEALYYSNGGILQYVLRQLMAGKAKPEAATA